MAKVKFTGGVAEMTGSIGGLTLQRWKSGVVSARKQSSAIANPHTLNQGIVRNAMSVYSAEWRNTLTDPQRAAWETYAASKPWSGSNAGGVNELIKFNNGIMSGFNAYVMVNIANDRIGFAPVTVAPLAITPPSAPLTVAVTCVAGTATVTWVAPVTAKVDALVTIWTRIEGIPGIHKQIIATPLAAALTYDMTIVRAANGYGLPLTALVGARLWVQMVTNDTDGTKSPRSNSASCIIA